MTKEEFKANFTKLAIKAKIYKHGNYYAAEVFSKADWVAAIDSGLFFDELVTIKKAV